MDIMSYIFNYSFNVNKWELYDTGVLIAQERIKTMKIYRKSVLSDICSIFYSKYFSPLLSYYQFQTFRYHTFESMPSDTFRDELALNYIYYLILYKNHM